MVSADEAKIKRALKMGLYWGMSCDLPLFTQVHIEAIGALERLVNSNGNAAPKPVPFLTVKEGEPVPGECPTGL